MESIINNPGLQHLAEILFLNLDTDHLKICELINLSCKQILENPIFWLKKFKDLSKENQKDWIEVIKEVKNSEKSNAIISYLQWNLKKEVLDLQCYNRPAVQDDFRKRIRKSCEKGESSDEKTEIVKILAPLTDDPNAPDDDGGTPIHLAARYGHIEIVKILVPLAENPISQHRDGATPIYMATIAGHIEIVKILAPLTKNPNVPRFYGSSPIHSAAQSGYTEIVKFLAPLTDNPNAPNKNGWTPIYCAAWYGHTEVIKFLASLTDNPNAPNKDGWTPIHRAAWFGHTEIVKFLAPLTDNPNAPDNDGLTPIMIARNKGSKEIEKILIESLLNHLLHAKLQDSMSLHFSELTRHNIRKQAAQKFYSMLVLQKVTAVNIDQADAFGPIVITKGPNFDKCVL